MQIMLVSFIVVIFAGCNGVPYSIKTICFDNYLLAKKPFLIVNQVRLLYLYYFRHNPHEYKFDYNWSDRNRFVAHAMGGINDDRYTNSLEAFKENYRRGFRVFEVDFVFSTDGQVIADHDRKFVAYNEFMLAKIHNKYSPLDIEAIINLMKIYPDIYIITDTKQDIWASLSEIVNNVNGNADVADRLIPQIYRPVDLMAAMEVYPFKSLCFTLYRTRMNDKKIYEFVKLNNIKCVVMSEERVNDGFVTALSNAGVRIYVHTINDDMKSHELMEKGIWGIYTDYLQIQK